jgi:hypothetical protein
LLILPFVFTGLCYVSSLGPEHPGSYGLVGLHKFCWQDFEPDSNGCQAAEHSAPWDSRLADNVLVDWPEPIANRFGLTAHIYTIYEPSGGNGVVNYLETHQLDLEPRYRYSAEDKPPTRPSASQMANARLLIKLHHPRGHVQMGYALQLTMAEYINLYRLRTILVQTLLSFKNLPLSGQLSDSRTLRIDPDAYQVSHQPTIYFIYVLFGWSNPALPLAL